EAGDWFVEWTPDMIVPGLAGNELNIEPLNGERGEILDKDGEQLAFNGMKETVGYTAGSTDEEDILSLSDELEMSEESLGNLLTRNGSAMECLCRSRTHTGLLRRKNRNSARTGFPSQNHRPVNTPWIMQHTISSDTSAK